jgi:uncharacterized protein YkwD
MPRPAALFLVSIALFAASAGTATVALAAATATASGNLIAPTAACPSTRLDAPATAQEQAMLCMTNFARERSGENALADNATLEASARDKSRDILRCDSFSHYACGREFTYWMRATGYLSTECWRAGENLAWGAEEFGTVRSIFRAWMRSPAHRENILGDFTQIGIDLQTGDLEGLAGTHVWTQHFGSHCEAATAPAA